MFLRTKKGVFTVVSLKPLFYLLFQNNITFMTRNILVIAISLLGMTLLSNCNNPASTETTGEKKVSLFTLMKEDKDFKVIPDSSSVKRIVLDSMSDLRDSSALTQASSEIHLTEGQVAHAAEMLSSVWKKKMAELEELRKSIANAHLAYTVNITSKSFTPLSKIEGDRDLTLAGKDRFEKWKNKRKNLDQRSAAYLTFNGIVLSPHAKIVDLRTYGLIDPPKDQGDASTCWAFSANEAYEAAYKISKNKDINTSEQEVINCSGAGSAVDGGVSFMVFRWMVDSTQNLDDSLASPYLATDNSCSKVRPNTDYFAITADLVSPDQNINTVPSVSLIKDAICKHGAISAAVYATDNWRDYEGGIFNDNSTYLEGGVPLSNHAILIIGWNDAIQCWLVKNSWGLNWGSACNESGYTGTEKGYIWVHYGCENIGKKASWVTPRK
jgi:C1A family cysteine protease